MDTHTELGTPCAKSWDDEWIAVVDAREAELKHRFCGARTMNGTPCILESDHPSGRCRHHGGFDLTGAPKGNRNAVVHGLYAQRLTVCGEHCPMWKRCPCASERVASLPPKDRPLCPYEQQIFETAYTDELGEIASWADGSSPLDEHLAHMGALHLVMLWRAAAAMAEEPLVETHPVIDNHAAPSSRVHAYTEAYCRISREYERWRRLMEIRRRSRKPQRDHIALPSAEAAADHAARQKVDTQVPQGELLLHEPHRSAQEAWAGRFTDLGSAAGCMGEHGKFQIALTRAQMMDRAKVNAMAESMISDYVPNEYQREPIRERLGLPQPVKKAGTGDRKELIDLEQMLARRKTPDAAP